MTPPQLTRDTPVLDVLQPAVPLRLGRCWANVQFTGARALITLHRVSYAGGSD